jgi:class 3 adenylate cyclase
MKHTANQILNKAATLMEQRGQQYDQPEGERSMGKTVAAFNCLTGQQLTEAQGWLLLALLKMVRDNQREKPHQDSCEDLVAYAALYAEARLSHE